MLIGLGAIVLVVILLILGIDSEVDSGGAQATDLIPVAPTSTVEGVSADPYSRDVSERHLPPNSTLSFRGQTVSSAGEILGIWEPEGLFAPSNGGPARSRADGTLGLSSGNLLKAPTGSELVFVYGGEAGSIDFLDVMAFEVERRELEYGEDIGTLTLEADKRGPVRPVVLPLVRPEMAGRKRSRIEADLPSGVYVISVAVAVPEGGVRYNFRVAIR